MKKLFFTIWLFLTLALMSGNAFAANRYFVGDTDNDWNDTGNWATSSGGAGGASVPGSSDIAYFDINSPDCTIDANITVAGINMSATYTGTITQSGSYTITVNGTFSQSGGTFSGGSGNITIYKYFLYGGDFTASSQTMIVGNGVSGVNQYVDETFFQKNGGNFYHNDGVLHFYTRTNQYKKTVSISGSIDLFDVKIQNRASDNQNTMPLSGTVNVYGTLYYIDGFTFGGVWNLYGDLEVTHTTTVSAITKRGSDMKMVGSANVTYKSVGGAMNSLIIEKSAGASVTPTGDSTSLTLYGGFEMKSGIFIAPPDTLGIRWITTNDQSDDIFRNDGGTFEANDGTVYMDGTYYSGVPQIVLNQSTSFYSLRLGLVKGSNQTVSVSGSAASSISVQNQLRFSGGQYSGGEIFVEGDVIVDSAFLLASFPIHFTGPNNQTYTDLGGNEPDGDITINKTAGTVTLASAAQWNASWQDVNILDGTLDLAGYTLSVNGTLNVDDTLQLEGGETVTYTTLALDATTSTVIYDGTSGPYTVKDWAYNDLIFNGSSGVFNLGATESVGGDLTITAGTLDISGYDLTVTGTFSNDDTFRLEGGESLSLTPDNDSGLVIYDGAGSYTGIGYTNAYNLEFNGSGDWTLDSALDVNGTFDLTAGTLDFNDQTVNIAGDITLADGASLDAGTGAVTLDGDLTYTDNSTTKLNFGTVVIGTSPDTTDLATDFAADSLTINSGDVFNTNGYDLDIGTGGITVNGTLDATDDGEGDDTTINLAGNWSKTGTFTADASTVILDGADQAISGETIFYNLTKTETTNDSTDVTLTMPASTTITIGGTLTLDGLDNNDRINIVSSTPATRSAISVSGAQTVSWLDVSDSEVSGSADITASYSLDTSNTDSGDITPQWVFVDALVGTCQKQDESTDCADGQTIKFAVNGSVQAQTGTTSGGAFVIENVSISSGDIITVWVDGVADALEAVAVTKYDGTDSITGIVLYEEHLTIGSDDMVATITNADLANYDNSVSGDEDIFFEVDANNDLTVDTTGNLTAEELHILAGWTYRLDSGGSGNVATHDIEILGTMTADANTITVDGDWTNSGTFTAGTSTVTFNATSGTQRLIGSTIFYNFTKIDPANDSTDVTLEVDDDSTITIAAGGDLNIQGIDDDDRVNLVSDNPGSRFDFSISANESVFWVDITDAEVSDSADIYGYAVGIASNTDSGGSSPRFVFRKHWTGATGDGLWSTAGNWNLSSKPGASDIAYFNQYCSDCDATIDQNITLTGLTMASTYTGTITQGNFSIILPSNWASSGIWDQRGGTFLGSATGASISVDRFFLSGGTFQSTSGTLTITTAYPYVDTYEFFKYTGGNFEHKNGTVRFNTARQHASNIQISSNISFHRLDFGTFIRGVEIGPARVIVYDTLIFRDGVQFFNGGSWFDLYGNLEVRSGSQSGIYRGREGSRIQFLGGADQTYTYTGGAAPNIYVAKTGGSVTPAPGTTNFRAYAFHLSGGEFVAPSGTFVIGTNEPPLANYNYQSAGVRMSFNGGTFTHNNGEVRTYLPVHLSSDISYFDFNNDVEFSDLYLSTENFANGIIVLQGSGTIYVENLFRKGDGILNDKSIFATKDVMIDATADGGTTSLHFTGPNDQTYTDLGGDEPDGDITIDKTAGTVTLASVAQWNATGQDVNILDGTLDLAGYNLRVNGTLNVDDTLQLEGGEAVTYTTLALDATTSTVIYAGTSGPYTVKDWAYNDLIFNGSSGVFNLGATESVGGDLTITAGTLDISGYDLTVTGTFSNDDTFRLEGGESLSLTPDNDSGLVIYDGAGSYTGIGYTNAYNLEFNGSGDWALGSALNVNGIINLKLGNLASANNDITVAGSWVNTGGMFTAGTETVTFNATSGTHVVSGGSSAFNEVVFDDGGGGATWEIGTDLTAGGDVTLTSGTLDHAGARDITVSGDLDLSGGTYGYSAWSYRKKITVDATQIDSDLTDYPVYVDLSTLGSDFFASAQTDTCHDIRVTKADGVTEVPREVVACNSTAETGELHFKATGTLPEATDTEFYIYYGNGAASDYPTDHIYGAENVWADYVFVSHDGGGTDSVNGISGTTAGTITVGGDASPFLGAEATFFNGTNAYIDYADNSAQRPTNLTLQAWLKNDGGDWNNPYEEPVSKRTGTIYNGYMFFMRDNVDFRGYASDGLAWQYAQTEPLDKNSWNQYTIVRGDDYLDLYLNGTWAAEDSSVGSSGITYSGTQYPLRVGRQNNAVTGGYFGGSLDEIRISSVARSADWISAEYVNQNSPGTFYAVGSEEDATNPRVVLAGTGARTYTTGNHAVADLEVASGDWSAVGNVDADGAFTVSGGTFTQGANNLSVGGDFTLANGITFTKATGGGTVLFDGDQIFTDNTSPQQDIGDVTIGASPDTTDLATDFTATSLIITAGDFLNTNGYDLYIGTGGITVNGTLDATDDVEGDDTFINLAGNWSKTGTFTADASTVILDGADQAISGETIFYNLTKTETTNDSTDVTLTMPASTTITIGGTLTLDGLDLDDRINIVSSTPGTRSVFSVSGAQTTRWLDVSDSEVSDSADIMALYSLDTSNTDSGDSTPQWVFADSLLGMCQKHDESTDCADGQMMKFAVNGVVQAETGITAGGAFAIDNVGISSGDIITVWVDGVADALEAVAVTKYDGVGDIMGITLYEEHLTIGSDDTVATISNADLANYDNSVSGDEDIFFEVDANNDLTVDTTGNLTQEELHILAGWTYRPDSGGSGNVATHDIEIRGTVTADANTIAVDGDWVNSGTFNEGTSEVVLNGADQAISGATTFYNLTKNENTNDSVDVTLTMPASETITITGALDLTGLDVDDRINIVSSMPGTRSAFSVSVVQITSWLDVSDSEVFGTADIRANHSINSGNTDFIEPSPHWVIKTRNRRVF